MHLAWPRQIPDPGPRQPGLGAAPRVLRAGCQRRWPIRGEPVEHILRQPGDVVLVVVVRQRSAVRNRAGRPDRATARGREVHDVAPNPPVLTPPGPRYVEVQL